MKRNASKRDAGVSGATSTNQSFSVGKVNLATLKVAIIISSATRGALRVAASTTGGTRTESWSHRIALSSEHKLQHMEYVTI